MSVSSHSHIQPEDSIGMEILQQRQEKEVGGGKKTKRLSGFVTVSSSRPLIGRPPLGAVFQLAAAAWPSLARTSPPSLLET